MKKILILFLVILSACSANKDKAKAQTTNDWVNAFKTHVFCSCITEGYQNDSIIKLIRKKDPIVVYDELTTVVLDKANVLGKKVALNIPEVTLPFEDENGVMNAKKKFILSNCLKYYGSSELDSIAHSDYQEYLRVKQ